MGHWLLTTMDHQSLLSWAFPSSCFHVIPLCLMSISWSHAPDVSVGFLVGFHVSVRLTHPYLLLLIFSIVCQRSLCLMGSEHWMAELMQVLIMMFLSEVITGQFNSELAV